jgi:hypothetical protein
MNGVIFLAVSLAHVGVKGFNGGWEFHLQTALNIALMSGFGAGLGAAMLVDCYPVELTTDGLKGTDWLGRRHIAAWPTIERVRQINVFGFRYLLVRSSAAPRTLWVPLFLSDRAGFCAAVVDRAGPAHPLTEALQMSRWSAP